MPIETKSLDVQKIREGYRYDPQSGAITSLHWKRKVGRKSKFGYVVISMEDDSGHRRTIFAHRIAYALMTGEDIPSGKFIDHINRNRSDNRWRNLRLCSHQQNLLNTHRERENGLPPGVYENKGSSVRPFKAKIKVGGISKYLGSFATIEQAKQAFDAAWSEAYGDPQT